MAARLRPGNQLAERASSRSPLADLTAEQRRLAALVEAEDRLGEVRTVAGADVSHKWLDRTGPMHAAVAVLGWPDLEQVETRTATVIPHIPYRSGYLGFREAPAVIAALARLTRPPGLLLVDGHGIAHPRGLGLASHVGILSGLPTIGVAKTRLIGEAAGEVGPEPGDRAEVKYGGRVIGLLLRTRRGAAPLHVSIGHRVTLDTAAKWVLACTRGRRLPETTRAAHDLANNVRRAAGS